MIPRALLRVVSPGPLTTVQDLGRPWAQPLGVPGGGAADTVAHRIANRLAGNPPGAAGLEVTLGGFEAEFLIETAGGLAGADLGFSLDGEPLSPGSRFTARPGGRLRAEGRRWGCRAYLGFGGGVAVPEVLGSRSTYLPAGFGGFQGRALRRGDVVDVLDGGGGGAAGRVPEELVPPYGRPGEVVEVRAVPGPQDDAFTEGGRRTFFQSVYEVSAQADRMGCRLTGPWIEHGGPAELISEGVAWGSVQVPGSGEPLVLLADRQTTGGYPKIATVATVDLPLLAQVVPGDRVRFREATLMEAREALVWAEYRRRRWEGWT